MKTPMQELIEWLDKYGDNRLYGGRELTIHEIKNKARQMLEKEEEVINEAYLQGFYAGADGFHCEDDYYNKTFNTKEK